MRGSDGILAFVTVLGGLSWGLGYLGQPHLIIRYMAIRDAKDIKIARNIAIHGQFQEFLGHLW